jgi:putative membrane protein
LHFLQLQEELNMKRILVTAGLACAMAVPGFASAQTASPDGQGQAGQSTPAKPSGSAGQTGSSTAGGQVASADRTFAEHAAQGGMAEVAMGKLAAKNASSSDVKQFGQRMVDDHGKADTELMSWASKNNVTLPTDVDDKQKAEQARIAKLSGAEFDRAYMTLMVADHNKDVAEFQRASKTAKDPDLKAWITKTLPTLEEHQKLAKDISSKLKGSAGETSPKTTGDKK